MSKLSNVISKFIIHDYEVSKASVFVVTISGFWAMHLVKSWGLWSPSGIGSPLWPVIWISLCAFFLLWDYIFAYLLIQKSARTGFWLSAIVAPTAALGALSILGVNNVIVQYSIVSQFIGFACAVPAFLIGFLIDQPKKDDANKAKIKEQ